MEEEQQVQEELLREAESHFKDDCQKYKKYVREIEEK